MQGQEAEIARGEVERTFDRVDELKNSLASIAERLCVVRDKVFGPPPPEPINELKAGRLNTPTTCGGMVGNVQDKAEECLAVCHAIRLILNDLERL